MSAESAPPVPASATAAPSPTTAGSVPATLHEARGQLPQLIRSAAEGQDAELARGSHRARLTSPERAAAAGHDLRTAPTHGIADARKKLGDLIQAAAEGTPQVLRRHTTPVAVLVPATDQPAAPGSTAVPTPASSGAEAEAEAPTPPRRPLAPLGQALTAVLTPTPGTPSHPTQAATPPGLPTGIVTLDHALGGLQPGRFYLAAGAPGAGSSLIATTAARTTALTHHRTVLYAASGLTRQDIAARVIAAHTPVDYRRLRAGTLTDDERRQVATTAELLTAAPLFIDDGTGLDADAITSTAIDIPDLALLVVDRLQATHDPRLPLSGPTALTDAVQALAHLARTHHLPVLAAIDSDDPALLQTLAADVTLTLTRDPRDPARTELTVTERDLGTLTTLTLTADLTHARLTDPAPVPAPAPAPAADAPAPTAPTPTVAPTPTAAPRPATPPPTAPTPAPPAAPTRNREYAGTGRDLGYYLDMITSAVDQALEEHDGDAEAASEALEKKAIPNGMALFDATRVGAAYEHTAYPERLEFLSKKARNGADDIWEGRHKWENAPLMAALRAGTADPVEVDVLDTNAAYCSALKTHLPIGALQQRPDGGFDPKRSGIYLLPARPAWHHPHLPDPIGNRHETGPLLLDDATVRLLIRCHKLGLAEAPHITQAWTSGASEGLLEKFRRVLTQAREDAITAGDPITEKYVKAIYAKFASTIGESTYNRDIRRPDWMHIIRSQAFANLWHKSQRAHQAGLTIVALRGTDELHVTGGEWRKAGGGPFEEGRLTTQLKLKNQYTLPHTGSRTRTRSV
ncbi:type II toxin-antitoxin system prevent-host-death family antitoxin [Kitasatospora sp. NPDC089509]|uniref:type II toxin-antitoxin system prevent-host-death family antitoxin n=1 Tax=Kitasatospora sp. NPDC089509 TaxID=3364079 RepID=UPI0038110EDB